MFPILENIEEMVSPLDFEKRSKLEKAHLLVSQRQFEQAARIFADLSEEMEIACHYQHAAIFHTQVAYAFADSQFEEAALSHARTALHLFLQCHLDKRSKAFYTNVIQVLANRNMKVAMNALQTEFEVKLGLKSLDSSEYLLIQHGPLPTVCPKCGAPISASDLHWVDETTAECNYCGTSIRSDNP
ncbi:MAG: hypothetical protein P4L50_30145 [Anaerolineaceae bacterium]|nr:hypothetical protein [Anaerolineaceae bacterium]